MLNNYTVLQFTMSAAGEKIALDMPLFLLAVCMLRAWVAQPQPNCIFGLARTIHCQFCEAPAYSDRALCTSNLAGMQVSITRLNLAKQQGLSAFCPMSRTTNNRHPRAFGNLLVLI